MTDLPNIGFRGYPVAFITEACSDRLRSTGAGSEPEAITAALALMVDTAVGPDEPSGWLFEAKLPGGPVWLSLSGDIRDESGLHGGRWTMHLPEEY